MNRIVKRLNRCVKQRLIGEGIVNYRGKGIINFIDVGSIGDLPSPWYENAHKIQHLIKFEPRDNYSKNSNIITLNTALWETNCEKNFYIYKGLKGSGSSFFQQNYEYVKNNYEKIHNYGQKYLANTWFERSQLERIEKINCYKLDDILKELAQPYDYHFLKIDSQGAEYEILKGAEDFLLETCIGLHLELFVLPLYRDIKLLSEVSAYLDSLGFDLVKKYPAHGTFNSQHDCIFLKRGHINRAVTTILKVYNL